MNWVNALYDLYEKNKAISGEIEEKKRKDGSIQKLVLLPVSHSTASAQIEVTIDSFGNFISARTVDKEDALTIIPVTEESASRTSGKEPHPLCDNLKYLASNYGDIFTIKKTTESKKEKDYTEFNQLYMQSLKKWCESPYAHPKAIAVYKYLKKGTLLDDLIKNNVLLHDEDGKYSEKVKIQGVSQTDAFVRFRVETVNTSSPDEMLSDEKGRYHPEVWLDQTLQQSFINYYNSQEHKQSLCYLTGKMSRKSDLHPKKIRNEGDGTKLISSNDSENYTFRGRFTDKEEAFSIGYEASQKIHNALKWIIRKQGYTKDGICIVAWESNLKPIATPFMDASDIADDLFGDDVPTKNDTNYIGAKDFNAAINGYKTKLDNTSNMVIMALDSATPGRLSITYFKEMPSSSYLENIRYWHQSCCWIHEKYIDKKLIRFEGMVSLDDIALLLYGTEQNERLELKTNSDGKSPIKTMTFNRLLPCIIERKRIPDDIVNTAVRKVASSVTYNRYNWNRILSVACSLVRKQKLDKNEGEWNMSLNNECNNRSYLYGRLLAVADRIEYLTFDSKEDRQTNAKRFMNAFSQRPFRTWQIIEEKIQPYLNKLSPGQKIFYSKLLDEIISKFNDDEFTDDSKLDGLYLLGYHNQSYALRKDSVNQDEEENRK
ncbi:MAG TPA: type I-C CRISPR-associated protein Cas8c/Csd1 [Clostridiaceae bacterium]|nr:type I-C CRISPR-associated protein Cas8c/Csd1 [Clostridiaceae bacterium]